MSKSKSRRFIVYPKLPDSFSRLRRFNSSPVGSALMALFLAGLFWSSLPVSAQSSGSGGPANPVLRPALPQNSSPATSDSAGPSEGNANGNDIDVFDPKQVKITRPELQGLVTIGHTLNPFQLDARQPYHVSLKDVLDLCLSKNLDISIAGSDVQKSKWGYRAALSGFLPNIAMGYRYNYLLGKINIPASSPEPIRFNNPFILASAGLTYPLYRGGRTIFGALQARNLYRASEQREKATISDVLKSAYEQYYKLMLEESILRIRIQAVKVSEEQLKLADARFDAGSATRLDVMQARTQLSQDRQRLIDQQVARRTAAVELADFLNLPQSMDILPVDISVEKCMIVDERTDITRLVNLALGSRPELKQREQERLAAKKDIVIKAAPLQPEVSFQNTVYGVGETLSDQTKTITIPSSTTGGAPRTATVSRQIGPLYVVGLNVNWRFDGMGMKDFSQVEQARAEARRAQLLQSKEVNSVVRQVRTSYLNMLRTDRQIEEALDQLRSAQEELKLARLRYESGLGKNIDILRAQSDYTEALIRKVTAIVNYDIAQGSLVRDIGMTTIDNLTSRRPVVF